MIIDIHFSDWWFIETPDIFCDFGNFAWIFFIWKIVNNLDDILEIIYDIFAQLFEMMISK